MNLSAAVNVGRDEGRSRVKSFYLVLAFMLLTIIVLSACDGGGLPYVGPGDGDGGGNGGGGNVLPPTNDGGGTTPPPPPVVNNDVGGLWPPNPPVFR